MYFKNQFLSEVVYSDSFILGFRTVNGSKINVGDVVYGVFYKYKNRRVWGHIKDIHLKYYKLDENEKQIFTPIMRKKKIKNKSKKL